MGPDLAGDARSLTLPKLTGGTLLRKRTPRPPNRWLIYLGLLIAYCVAGFVRNDSPALLLSLSGSAIWWREEWRSWRAGRGPWRPTQHGNPRTFGLVGVFMFGGFVLSFFI